MNSSSQIKPIFLAAFFALLGLNFIKFIGINVSPPGFYGDETAGATQVLCLLQDRFDFFGNHRPLFAEGFPGAGQYTPIYLYGQQAWVTIFGSSVESFRSFLGLVTCLTILFLFLWVKRVSNTKTAFYVALSASIMPWSFQFSRIAWDPPLAPLFLVMAIWSTSLSSMFRWQACIFLALAAYSYPPMRITAPVFFLLMPGLRWNYKIFSILGAGIICIPLFLKIQDPEFLTRSRALAIWTYFNFNPYENLGIFSIPTLFLKQFASYLTPDFLFFSGDTNLRHSTQKFGMLSWLDLTALLGIAWICIKKAKDFSKSHLSDIQFLLLRVALIGIALGIAPAALTNTSFIPNALRAIGAWPFFALLTGVLLVFLEHEFGKRIRLFFYIIAFSFFCLYINNYFFSYPFLAKNDFGSSDSPIENAYLKMSRNNESCKNLRVINRPPLMNEEIYFSYGHANSGIQYLRNHWLELESWGIWTNDKGSDLLIPLPQGNVTKIIFNTRALVTGIHPEVSVDIWMNGKFVKNVVLKKFEGNEIELDLPKNIHYPNKLWIEFRNLNPTTPVAAGIPGNDTRITGVGLVSATFK